MRKTLGAALIGLTVTGGMVIAGAAQAQPYPYYYPPATGYYDNGYYRPAPPAPYYNGYYNGYSNRYYGYGDSGAGLAGALIGSLLGDNYAGPPVPVDRYGPDPNGMIAPDGHRIKCKLRTGYDGYGHYGTYRQCW
ncbi:hypothetical protein [Phenylobacterium soli]|uniref:Lectin-like protein BA14k n=1 Tax=Phenylobacterium soli TaxID=2170551 RepID=A0A328AE72_9CAUL|nr:hypothetical protein [Phenylobacterium soli]RAK51694.1 hypothetical protein DJ017_17835 [Phenylobacterium soli]